MDSRNARPLAVHTGVLLLLSILCLVRVPLGAQSAPETKEETKFVEPILTEETMPNEPRELTLRATADSRKRGDESSGALPRVQLFYGLADGFGAELSAPLAYQRGNGQTNYGPGDVSLGLKYRVVKHSASLPAVVLGLEVGFPTGDENRGLGEGAYELEPFVALLKDFGRFSLQGNFGWSKQLTLDREDRFTYNWALAAPMIKHTVHLLMEINGDWGRDHQTTIASGLKYNFTDNLFVGVATPFGLNKSTPTQGLVIQFQFRP